MTPAELEQLRAPAGRALVEALTPYDPAGALADADRFRREHEPSLVALALTQARLRTKAAERFGDQGTRMWWTAEALEQATRPEVSARRSALLRDAGGEHVADLGCGAGMDALAMAQAGMQVLAVDRDPTLVELVAANADELGLSDGVRVRRADLTTIDAAAEGCDTAFLDPARRADGRRHLDPERWSPPFSVAVEMAQRTARAVIKVAPGLDRALVPEGARFEAVSYAGRLVEAAIWFGVDHGGASRNAVVLPAGAALDDLAPRPERMPVGRWGTWVVEPDDAVIRSGLVAQLAARFGGRLVDASIAYVTSDTEPPADPLYARFEVDEVLPFSLKALRAALRERRVGRVEVKKRGFAMDPDEVRRGLKLDKAAPGARTVLLTRVGSDPVAVIAHRR